MRARVWYVSVLSCSTILTAALALWLMVAPVALGLAEPAPQPTEDLIAGPAQGPWRRLFLDAMVVEKQQGLSRLFHAAEKYPGNPVLRKDKPWEGTGTPGGPYLYGTVMWDEGKLRM